jgi:hypothetical protein
MELFYILIIGIYNYAIYFVSFPLIESPFKLFSITLLHFVFVTFLAGLYSKLFLISLPIEIPKLFLCLYLSIIPVIFVWSTLRSQNFINRMNNFKGWECDLGVDWIAFKIDGSVSGICGNSLYANNEVGIYH